jgi:hypothetical protein
VILVYCDHITPRHEFVFDFMLAGLIGSEFRLTRSDGEFAEYPGPKFCYSADPRCSAPHFRPAGLLDETGIQAQNIRFLTWDGITVFFETDETASWPFDPFSLVFYLVSRYEEYLPFREDEHGRFTAGQSLAVKGGFLGEPVADILAAKLKALLEESFPGNQWPARPFRLQPTFDIDIAYAHLAKGPWRATAAWAKLLLKADLRSAAERFQVLGGKKPDPFDNFDLHLQLADRFEKKIRYFVLAGDFGRYDRNTSFRHPRFRKLIRKLYSHAEIGIHPSYRSFLHPELLTREKERLEDITGGSVSISRFHFLRMKFPESYRILLDAGITDDFSMGYSQVNGFRAGTCSPFRFYDLPADKVTPLKIHPFVFMDSAMADHLKLSPEQGERDISAILDKIRTIGGDACGVWHNYALSDVEPYHGWRNTMIQILSKY